MNRRLAALCGAAIALAVLSIALVGGCGGGTLSAPQFRSDATKVCQLADRRTSRIKTPASPAQGEAFLRRGITVLQSELAELRKLKPPSTLAPSYPAALTAFQSKLDALRAAVRSIGAGADPVIATNALQQRLAPIETREDGLWRSLGLPACVNR